MLPRGIRALVCVSVWLQLVVGVVPHITDSHTGICPNDMNPNLWVDAMSTCTRECQSDQVCPRDPSRSSVVSARQEVVGVCVTEGSNVYHVRSVLFDSSVEEESFLSSPTTSPEAVVFSCL